MSQFEILHARYTRLKTRERELETMVKLMAEDIILKGTSYGYNHTVADPEIIGQFVDYYSTKAREKIAENAADKKQT